MLAIDQVKYLPEVIQDVYLGMSMDEFKKVKDISNLHLDINEFVSYVNENIQDENICAFIYQFDRHKKLYEIIIDFRDSFDLNKYLADYYGEPNQGNEWHLHVPPKFYYKIWRFRNRLCIADRQYFAG